jgi:hypothetical protein
VVETYANALLLNWYLNQKYLGVVVPLATVYFTEMVSPTFNPVVGVTDWLIVNCPFTVNVNRDSITIPTIIKNFFILFFLK